MKRVGLITWFHHNNYGSVLQAVAISNVIRNLNYDCTGINYEKKISKTELMKKVVKPTFILKKVFRTVKNRRYKKEPYNKERKKSFDKFRSTNLNLIDVNKINEFMDLNNLFDIFVCGSDQIWTPYGYNGRYYLDFVNSSKNMISYAPSFGVNSINEKNVKHEIKNNLKRFDHISVREETGANIIRDLGLKNTNIVLDPTLLLSWEEWDKYSIKVSLNNRSPYILCYFLGQNESYWNHVSTISRKYNLQIIIIPIHNKDFYRGYCTLDKIGPGEFLYLIKNAKFVCTDSYHGTLFSLIYNVPFLTYKRFNDAKSTSQNSRVKDFLKKIGLENKIIDDCNEVEDDIFNIKFSEVNKIIQDEKSKSIHYLENALNYNKNILN